MRQSNGIGIWADRWGEALGLGSHVVSLRLHTGVRSISCPHYLGTRVPLKSHLRARQAHRSPVDVVDLPRANDFRVSALTNRFLDDIRSSSSPGDTSATAAFAILRSDR